MPFKIKDLMISVVPQGYGAGAECGCSVLTLTTAILLTPVIPRPPVPPIPRCVCTAYCSRGCSGACSGPASLDPGWFDPGRPPEMPGVPTIEDLGILKQQLRKALEQVEVHERVLEESLKPKTLEEVEQLEVKLKEALAELHARKTELQNISKQK